jgi:hypothetical protein
LEPVYTQASSEIGRTLGDVRGGERKERVKDGDTILTGEVIDQPHLYGILDRINAIGLELLSVQALPEDVNPTAERNGEPKP